MLLMLPSSLFTECHKVNQIQQTAFLKHCNHWALMDGRSWGWGCGGVTHIDTQNISGLNEYPQCPLLETEKCTFKL